MKHLLVITGPTAIGKTALSIELATHFQCEILSADSRQFFKEMSIGTAKPTQEEMGEIPHHFINSHSITDKINAGRFEEQALEILKNLYQKYDVAIVVGGSGLYIDALCRGIDVFPEVAREIRALVNKNYEEQDKEDDSCEEELDHNEILELMHEVVNPRAPPQTNEDLNPNLQ